MRPTPFITYSMIRGFHDNTVSMEAGVRDLSRSPIEIPPQFWGVRYKESISRALVVFAALKVARTVSNTHIQF